MGNKYSYHFYSIRGPASEMSLKKKKKGVLEITNLLLYIDDLMVCAENSKESPKTTRTSKVIGHLVSIQNSIVFLFTSKKY